MYPENTGTCDVVFHNHATWTTKKNAIPVANVRHCDLRPGLGLATSHEAGSMKTCSVSHKLRGSDNKLRGLPAVDFAGVYFDFDFGSGSTSKRRSRKEAGNRSRKKTPRYWKARWPDAVGSVFGVPGSSAPGGLES